GSEKDNKTTQNPMVLEISMLKSKDSSSSLVIYGHKLSNSCKAFVQARALIWKFLTSPFLNAQHLRDTLGQPFHTRLGTGFILRVRQLERIALQGIFGGGVVPCHGIFGEWAPCPGFGPLVQALWKEGSEIPI